MLFRSMFSQTLGTALGDWTADSAGLGYVGAAVVFGAALLAIGAAYFLTKLSRTLLLLADAAFADAHVPELVITVGRVGLSRPVARQVARAGMHLQVDGRSQWSDAGRTADAVLAQVPLPPSPPA